MSDKELTDPQTGLQRTCTDTDGNLLDDAELSFQEMSSLGSIPSFMQSDLQEGIPDIHIGHNVEVMNVAESSDKDEQLGIEIQGEQLGIEIQDDQVGIEIQDEQVGIEIQDEQVGIEIQDDQVGIEIQDEQEYISAGGRGVVQVDDEEPDSEDDDEHEHSSTPGTKGKRGRYPKPVGDEDVFIKNTKQRTKTAKARAATLQETAMLLHRRTGAEVKLACRYQGLRKEPYVFEYTSPNFSSNRAHEVMESSPVSQESVREAVTEALATWSPPTTQTQPQARSSQDLFSSPSTREVANPRRRLTGNCCFICGGVEEYIVVKNARVSASFFHCSFVGCKGRAHNDCLGLPQITNEEIAGLAPWMCPVHVGTRRPPIQAEVDSNATVIGQDDGNQRSSRGGRGGASRSSSRRRGGRGRSTSASRRGRSSAVSQERGDTDESLATPGATGVPARELFRLGGSRGKGEKQPASSRGGSRGKGVKQDSATTTRKSAKK